MFRLMGKKIMTVLRSNICLTGPMYDIAIVTVQSDTAKTIRIYHDRKVRFEDHCLASCYAMA